MKGKNVLLTKEYCMNVLHWTEERYNNATVYCPYIPLSIEPTVCMQRKQSEGDTLLSNDDGLRTIR